MPTLLESVHTAPRISFPSWSMASPRKIIKASFVFSRLAQPSVPSATASIGVDIKAIDTVTLPILARG